MGGYNRAATVSSLLVLFTVFSENALAQSVEVPARVEAESFTKFYDLTADNSGASACGAGDVDMQITGDTSGHCNIGWTQAGEWTEYSLSAAAEGPYSLSIRAATAYSGRKLHVEIDGVDVTGPLLIPHKGWQVYSDVVVPVELKQGAQQLRLVHDTGSVNINYFELTATAAEPVPELPSTTLPARIEAEKFTAYRDTTAGNAGYSACNTGDMDSELTKDIDGHCNIGWTVAGEWTEYRVRSETAATYDLTIRAATARSSNYLHVEVNGVNVSGALLVPAKGWQSYSNISVPLDLTAGLHLVRLVYDTGSSNINYLNFVTTSAPEPVDADGDGVADEADLCPGTGAAASVDANGCSLAQLDDDGDGLANGNDLCPDTSVDDAVDSQGCSYAQQDEDGDGVANAGDLCPATLTSEPADSSGCSVGQLDDDGDGINNALDLCPKAGGLDVTGYGCAKVGDEDLDFIVNERDLCPFDPGVTELRGCPSALNDLDRDGVWDAKDQCPYSISANIGAETSDPHFTVDESGCSPADQTADTDADMVADGFDQCPYSGVDSGFFSMPTGVTCSDLERQDSDSDGIMNGLDVCLNEFGASVTNGCVPHHEAGELPHDLDEDGVSNELDHCPFSPRDEDSSLMTVGPNGCNIVIEQEDLDQDGVANGLDSCPGTRLGHTVDSRGCSGPQQQQLLDDDADGVNNAQDFCADGFAVDVGLYGCMPHQFDADADGIPDQIDQCPFEPGLRLAGGCPSSFSALEDADRDHQPDSTDSCPFSQPAKAPFFVGGEGCYGVDLSDKDADGVLDGRDLCPNTAIGSFMADEGCGDLDRLDWDRDGVVDGMDICPRTAGLPSLNGCSQFPSFDGDGDGVENLHDLCPYTPHGTSLENFSTGCATFAFEDSDGDLVANGQDQCPESRTGFPVDPESGCTQAQRLAQQSAGNDADGDGVEDWQDQCPGTSQQDAVDVHGCPTGPADKDRDNVPDHFDRCLDSRFASPLDPDGCEILHRPLVPEGITRAHAEEFSVLTVTRNDVVFAANPRLDLNQPFIFDVGSFAEEGEVFIHSSFGDWIDIDVPPHLRNRSIVIPLRVKLGFPEVSSNWFTLTIGNAGAAMQASLLVNNAQVLTDSGITLRQVFGLLAGSATEPDADLRLFRQFWDSQRSQSVLGLSIFCEGHMNGFPIVCDRPETDVVFLDDSQLAAELENYRLTAAINRLDKHNQWQDCGEHGLAFALQNNAGGRNFFNVEARVPNPIPGDVLGCRSVIEFWRDLPQLSPQEQSMALFEFFYGARVDGPPIIAPENFLAAGGQIRSTQFVGGDWLFKEHKVEQQCDEGGFSCRVFICTVSVKENPFGPLFDPASAEPGAPYESAAKDFQAEFPQQLSGLLTNEFSELKNPVAERFNHGQSHASGPAMLENDYGYHYAGQFWTPFGEALQNVAHGAVNADGSPLRVEQLLSRATALTCAGCHAPGAFGLTQPGRIGALKLPDGSVISAWPASHDFVHINEAGQLSPALEQVFLPVRAHKFAEVLRLLGN